ncbi:hypothetical protein QBC46DRAFT_68068 [Diplogelasinospora grovesii]|uniref:Uncharacterized protein n=1 Tax=Diplogelasinospora grovesii TaxID=303347 RepID=A0AAN6RZW1_9PEZI|nr:hypothetical protein QBC46DRAFT_68068 [Diplogelasinospora grovesii]
MFGLNWLLWHCVRAEPSEVVIQKPNFDICNEQYPAALPLLSVASIFPLRTGAGWTGIHFGAESDLALTMHRHGSGDMARGYYEK